MRNIGLDVKPPRKTCADPRCPFHGKLSIRGRLLKGTVMSLGQGHTVVVQREYLHFFPKIARYEKRRRAIHAHLPPCITLKQGEMVAVAECRPLAKTVPFVVVERGGN